MTTKPKGKKYRIRRAMPATGAHPAPAGRKPAASAATASAAAAPDTEDMPFAQTEDGFGDQKFSTAAADEKARSGASGPGDENSRILDEIRKEGLTSRQLRMAKRVAIKHGLNPRDEFDAIRLLRAKGIDPFKRSTILELVAPVPDGADPDRKNLPQKVSNAKLPSTEVLTDDARAREVIRIQRDIARRRRRRMAMLLVRLSVFVFLPTFLVGVYYYNFATPLYATRSEFLVQKADAGGGGGGLGGLFSGSGFSNAQDSITVQSYLQSRDAMIRLDKDAGFRAHFSQPDIDPMIRLEPNSTNEEAYRLYKKMVKIGFDPTEGMLKMEVIAADPEVSAKFSRALIAYAEEQVDKLTQRLRKDQMRGARESYEEAERKMLAAQEKVLALQERLGVIDPASETATLMGQIANFETQLQEKKLQLQQLLDNSRPNQARVEGVKGDIKRLEKVISDLRSQLTEGGADNTSLARVSAELKIAQIELETRQALMQQSLKQLETARIEANRQVRYLSLGVSPTPPDEATYPRRFENTVVAFLIFSGLYLMASLTASILREQVGA